MQKEIQKFIECLDENGNHSSQINEMELKMCSDGKITMFLVNGILTHATTNKTYMRKILKEWKEGKRELKKIKNYGLLVKNI